MNTALSISTLGQEMPVYLNVKKSTNTLDLPLLKYSCRCTRVT